MAVTPEQTAQTLRLRSEQARALGEARATAVRRSIIELVRQRLSGDQRVWLIGSLAWGGFDERSDIDLVFSSVPAPVVLEIELAICQMLKREVDVLLLHELPAAFAARVQSEGIPLHGPKHGS